MNTWKRYELKEQAKQGLKKNYWIAFVVALIFVIISGGLNLSNSGWRTNFNVNFNARHTMSQDWEYDSLDEFIREASDDVADSFRTSGIAKAMPFIGGAIIIIAFLAIVFGTALNIFVLNPLKMGCQTFFKTSAESPHNKMNDLGTAFRDGNYGSVVKAMFFRDLYIFLWSLLFIIPGIIKSYSYRMVPYILADNPKMDANEAVTLSRRMMDGQKWKAFVLDLSFIGWYILGALAFGIGVLFVNPYKFSTDAQLYLALRGERPQELPQAQA